MKKLAAIPAGGGWRHHGRGNNGHHGHGGAGYRYLHTAIDDRTRLVYSEILDDEQALTAARFWGRAAAWFATHGVAVERVLTDNGCCYRSGHWHRACAATGTTVKKTRPRRPQTNGKVERFHRILLEEWAYIRVLAEVDVFNVAMIGRMLERATESGEEAVPHQGTLLPGRFARAPEEFATVASRSLAKQ